MAMEKVMQVFRDLDKDNSGTIEGAEVKALLQKLNGKSWTDDKVDAVVKIMDTNHDGLISFEEFIAWAFKSQDAGDFRSQTNLSSVRPKVIYKKFPVTISDGGVAKTFENVHPAHKARVIFERVAIQFFLPPSEIILCWKDQARPRTETEEETLADWGWDQFCVTGTEIPPMFVRCKEYVNEQIRALQLERNRIDDELLGSIWYGERVNKIARRASKLDVPGFECKITLLQKGKSKAAKFKGSEEEVQEFPIVVFSVGDPDNPNAVYGKQVFPLLGATPKPEHGFSDQWFEKPAVLGALQSDEMMKELEDLRAVAKEEAGRQKQEATEGEAYAAAEKKMKDTYAKVAMPKFKQEEKAIISECVAPFLQRVFMKIQKPPDIEDDGKYVSNLKNDGFEIAHPVAVDPPKGSRDKYWKNSILGVSTAMRLRMFKSLMLLSVDATAEDTGETD